ncbi:MAG: pyrroline-5-carboxylate reductase [Desulfuromonas sp.]|nr:MAG: pyrroline-5-carboxylate reductase [Desulfuromonas sp.]
MIETKRVAFVGGGNMAEALIRGLLQATLPAEKICVGEPSLERGALLRERYGVTVLADNREVVAGAELVVLAIKPQVVDEVVSGIADLIREKQTLVSILAGVSTERLERFFDGTVRVVRAMPNTPALVGAGATALCAGRFAGIDELALARHLFEAVGSVRLVGEGQMDAVTGLSGSGPAYVYTVIEALADGGVAEGLPRETALALATQTVLGTAQLVSELGEHPAVLRDRVCSPGGTTIAGMRALEDGGLRPAMMEAVARASRRSKELGAD